MRTHFGMIMKNIRKKRRIFLYDQAKSLKLTASELSRMEWGKMHVPSALIENIIEVTDLTDEEVLQLRRCI
ncbi:hypothetical protein [Entomobacter blattae]|uniref:HTH cro/C1-type domain-containing protein n=1 Tax=Entomobacter blattae TaxID=2762277 RepID=A0A7H1NU08_9PROT|nr:hypothetical protein [Entomobacter blattae]QNT79268.1 hypothetical protein JGUZn3_20630 [Entomobacter blattae]